MKKFLEFIKESINGESSFGLYNMTNGDMQTFINNLKDLEKEKSNLFDDKYFQYEYKSKENFLEIQVYDSRLADKIAEIIKTPEINGYKAEPNDKKEINRISITSVKFQ
jgi:hypothetical protein